MTIWKFPLAVADAQDIEMPVRAKILAVQPQADVVCLWALVDETAPHSHRRIYIQGTGHPCEGLEHLNHIGTFQIRGGSLVFHVFDGGER